MTLLDTETALQQLSIHYDDGRLIPFIGSGFSQSLGLPTWDELIESIAEELGFESDLFLLHGSFAQLADYVQSKNRSVWQSWLNRMTIDFDSKDAVQKRKNSIAHQALAALQWHTIYTTNYDAHIEGALADAKVNHVTLSSLADFLEPRKPNACEIIKFHGTLKDPKTIILTESHYFDRMGLESAPDQRLRSDLLSNSFMFLGYSFNDPNIRFIWYKIHQLREREQQKDKVQLQTRPCFFVTFGVNPVQPILLDKWNIHIVLLDPQNKPEALSQFIRAINEAHN